MRARGWLAALLVLVAARPALAERDFRIGTTPFAQAEILDARAIASLAGQPAILVTLTDAARSKLTKASTAAIGQSLDGQLDGRTLPGPIVREAIADGMIELSGPTDFAEGEALALRIAGKPPVPDSLEE